MEHIQMYISVKLYPKNDNEAISYPNQEICSKLSLCSRWRSKDVDMKSKIKPIFWVCEAHEPLATFPIAHRRCVVCGNGNIRLVDWLERDDNDER